MTCCPQAPCRPSLDSTIGVKMLNLKGFKSCNISCFSLHYLQTGNISVLAKWSSTRTFQLTQMILLSWNSVSKLLYNPSNRKSFLAPWVAAILREASSAAESDCAGTLVRWYGLFLCAAKDKDLLQTCFQLNYTLRLVVGG